MAVQLAETLTSASFSKTLNVHPVGVDGGVIDGVKRTGGVMGYGADGAYINGVYLITLCMVAFFRTKDGAPPLPPSLAQDLGAVGGAYVRHANADARCSFLFRDTAVSSKLNRDLDCFMMVNALKTLGCEGQESHRSIIKRHNQTFFSKPQMQVVGKADFRIRPFKKCRSRVSVGSGTSCF